MFFREKYPIYKYEGKLYSEHYWDYVGEGDNPYEGDVINLIEMLEDNDLVYSETVYHMPEGDYKYSSPEEIIEDYDAELDIEVIKSLKDC